MPAKRTSQKRAGAPAGRAARKAARSAAVPRRPSRFAFIAETIAEMKKVTWLSRRELAYLTGLVLLVTVTVGAILGVIDLGFSALVNALLGR